MALCTQWVAPAPLALCGPLTMEMKQKLGSDTFMHLLVN